MSLNNQTLDIVDLNASGFMHEQFNASMLNIFAKVFKHSSIQFFAEKTHVEIISERLIHFEHFSFQSIPIYRKQGGIHEILKGLRSYFILLKILIGRKRSSQYPLILLYIHPLTLFLINCIFSGRKIHMWIVMHGELESLKLNKTKLNKIWGHLLRLALKNFQENQKYILLGESIRINLLRVLPFAGQLPTMVIDHPFPFREKVNSSDLSKSLIFCTVGVNTIHKSSHFFYTLASRIAILKLNAKCILAGKVYQDLSSHLNQFVESKKIGESYSRDEIYQNLSKSHFAIFYYDNTNYSLCASGAFWECVDAELPLIFVVNDYFMNYQEQAGGPIGYHFYHPEALNDFVIDLIRNGIDPIQFEEFRRNLSFLKRKYSEDYIASQIETYKIAEVIK